MNFKRTIIEKLGGDDVKKLLEALDGQKAVLGLLIASLPDIANQIAVLLSTIAPVLTGLQMDDAAAYVIKASGLILAGIGGLHKIIKLLAPLLKDKPPPVAPLILLLALASPTFAQEPTPQPAPEYSLSTGGVSVVTTGVKHEYFAARLSLKAILNQRDSIHSRVTLTGSQDGGSLEFGDPATFRSVVPEIEYRRTISDAVAFAVLGNVTFSAEGEQGKPIDPRMFTGCAGFRGALKDSTWLQVSGCFAGPVGSKPALGVRGGRTIGNGEAWFDFTLPVQADALRNKAWVLSVGSTLTVAHGQVR